MAKVCHITSVHKWNDIRIFKKECCSLAKAGFDTHLLVANSTFSGLAEGVHIHTCNIGSLSRLQRIQKSAILMRPCVEEVEADIYHLHDPELIPLGSYLTRHGKKVVFDAHEDTAADILRKDIFPKPMRYLVSAIYNWYEKKTLKKFAGVVSVTEKITEAFKHPNSTTIKNYPLLDRFVSLNLAEKREKIVMYAGGLMEIRGIYEIIKAMEYLPDYSLVLAGDFDDTAYFEKCKSLPQWKQVNHLGFIPLEEVYQWLAKASLGFTMLYPTKGHLHSLPIKTFEYMAAEIPVLMTDIPYWREIFGTTGFYANAYDSVEIGQKAKKIVENYPVEKIKEAKTLVMNEFDWESEAQKLINLYHTILSN